jgi:hypothetical protein
MFWEWEPFSCSVGVRKIMIHFVVKASAIFGSHSRTATLDIVGLTVFDNFH